MTAIDPSGRRARMALMADLSLLVERIEDYRDAMYASDTGSSLAASLSALAGDLVSFVGGGLRPGPETDGQADDLELRASELAALPHPDAFGERLAVALDRLAVQARSLAAPSRKESAD